MEELLTGAGILCIAAVLLTRQLQAAGRSIPVFVASSRRQALLAAFGGLLLAGALLTHLIYPTPEASSLHATITPPHATDAPPSISDAADGIPAQMSGQGASSEGPGTTHGSVIERSDHPASTEDSEDQLRSRGRERKREP